MSRKIGWAAYLATVLVVFTTGSGAALAAGNAPVYACFSPDNAAMIGRLGANDSSVSYGFETGECLALAPMTQISELERAGSGWRFRAFGAQPYLYAPDWAMSAAPPPSAALFERYIGVTSRLFGTGRTFADCYDRYETLSARYLDFDRRWSAYWGQPKRRSDDSPVLIIHLSNEGPMLFAERERLSQDTEALNLRCAAVLEIELSREFVAFIRTARIG